MAARTYDIITVGGGIAASSLARAIAERGARVLVLERENQFNLRTVCAERLLCPGVWTKRINSEFVACSRKSAAMMCLTLKLVRGYETSEQRRCSSYLYFPSRTR